MRAVGAGAAARVPDNKPATDALSDAFQDVHAGGQMGRNVRDRTYAHPRPKVEGLVAHLGRGSSNLPGRIETACKRGLLTDSGPRLAPF
jgi:hypothetical protein